VTYILHHLLVVFFLVALHLGIIHGVGLELLSVWLLTSNVLLLLYLEKKLPRKLDYDRTADTQKRNDIAHFFTFSSIRFFLEVFGVVTIIRYQQSVGADNWWPAEWPISMQIVFAFFLWQFMVYVRHRTLHTSWVWPIHKLHHDLKRLHVLKSFRVHFLDDLFSIPFELILPAVLGAPAEVYFYSIVWNFIFGNLIHSNIRQENPYWMHYLVPTVQFHEWHHEEMGARTNYSNSLPIFDVIFGTFQHPDEVRVAGLGVGEETPSNYLMQLRKPFSEIWEKLVA
jgi:sterol desaturase/sphingolipid hydroxylase (fatty acid hydroxylase superfamily)